MGKSVIRNLDWEGEAEREAEGEGGPYLVGGGMSIIVEIGKS